MHEANLETSFETISSWVGRVSETSEALMYAGHPIFNSLTKEFGYLGYNPQEKQYEFYLYDELSTFMTLLYEFNPADSGIELADRAPYLSSSQQTWFTYIEEAILFMHGSALIKLPIPAIFDDDQTKEREQRFENPLFTFQHLEDSEYIYNSDSDQLLIRDGLSMSRARTLSSNDTIELIKDYSGSAVQAIHMHTTARGLVVRKFFEEHEQQAKYNNSSSVILNSSTSSVIELTQYPTSEAYLNYVAGSEGNLLIHGQISADDQTSLAAQNLGNNLTTVHPNEIPNSIWGRITNMTGDDGQAVEQAIASSNDTSLIPTGDRDIPALSNANLYEYHSEQELGQGRLMGSIPGELTEIVSIDIKSDFHGELKLKNSYELDAPTKTFFFPSNLSFINPTGNFGDMKFMYDDAPVSDELSADEEAPSEDAPLDENTAEEPSPVEEVREEQTTEESLSEETP